MQGASWAQHYKEASVRKRRYFFIIIIILFFHFIISIIFQFPAPLMTQKDFWSLKINFSLQFLGVYPKLYLIY